MLDIRKKKKRHVKRGGSHLSEKTKFRLNMLSQMLVGYLVLDSYGSVELTSLDPGRSLR